MIKVGHLTCCIRSMFLKRSFIAYDRNFPAIFDTTFLKEVNGDINIRIPGFRLAARCVAGPLPMLLPNMMMFFSFTFRLFTK